MDTGVPTKHTFHCHLMLPHSAPIHDNAIANVCTSHINENVI
jgi:hypothetical protein